MPSQKPPFPPLPGQFGGRQESRAERRMREKAIAKLASKIESRRAAQRYTGAGYPIDQALREFLDHYNERVFELKNLPFSFNVLQAFVKPVYEEGVEFFELRPERDHAFLIGDFLDFATSIASEGRGIDRLRSLPEGIVLNYSPIGDVKDLAFMDERGNRVVIGGFAMVRAGDRLNWVMIGGTITDLEVETARLREDAKDWAGRSEMLHADAKMPDLSQVKAEPLPGTDDVWKTISYGVFNLQTRSHESRTFSRDHGVMYSIISDDPASMGVDSLEQMDEDKRSAFEAYSKLIDEHSLIFDLAETAFLLPSYFAFRIDLVRETERRTAIGENKVPRKDQADVLRAPPGTRLSFRKVTSLDVINLSPPESGTRSYTPPRFSVELDGFWRRLNNPNSIGKDAQGNPVQGMTWVRGHIRWRDRPARRSPVLVKSSVTAAQERAAEIVMEDETSEVIGMRL